jgi:prolyl-tRNA synthetase
VRAVVASTLSAVSGNLLAESARRQSERTVDVTTVAEAVEAAGVGFGRIAWDVLGVEGETELARHGVSVRCLQRPDGGLAEADDEPDLFAVVARSY